MSPASSCWGFFADAFGFFGFNGGVVNKGLFVTFAGALAGSAPCAAFGGIGSNCGSSGVFVAGFCPAAGLRLLDLACPAGGAGGAGGGGGPGGGSWSSEIVEPPGDLERDLDRGCAGIVLSGAPGEAVPGGRASGALGSWKGPPALPVSTGAVGTEGCGGTTVMGTSGNFRGMSGFEVDAGLW